MSDARKSGMRGMEREEKPAERPGDNFGDTSTHVKADPDGQQHFDVTSFVDALEQQKSGPHDDREGAFKKPNADKFEKGATQDSEKDAKGNENG